MVLFIYEIVYGSVQRKGFLIGIDISHQYNGRFGRHAWQKEIAQLFGFFDPDVILKRIFPCGSSVGKGKFSRREEMVQIVAEGKVKFSKDVFPVNGNICNIRPKGHIVLFDAVGGIKHQILNLKCLCIPDKPEILKINLTIDVVNIITCEISTYLKRDISDFSFPFKTKHHEIGILNCRSEIKLRNFILEICFSGKIHHQVTIFDLQFPFETAVTRFPIDIN